MTTVHTPLGERYAETFAPLTDAMQERYAETFAPLTDAMQERYAETFAPLTDAMQERYAEAFAPLTDAMQERYAEIFAPLTDAMQERYAEIFAPLTDSHQWDSDRTGAEAGIAARRAVMIRAGFCAYLGTLVFLLGTYWWLEYPAIANAALAELALLEAATGFAIWLYRLLDDGSH
jgi:hypothetical protein